MNNVIQYLNTDLDFRSHSDIRPLIRVLNAAHISGYVPECCEDGTWHASVWVQNAKEPEPNISQMLSAIESLGESLRRVWDECTLREFNVGYDCGREPWAFNQGLSSSLIARIAGVGASVRLTLYPDKSERGGERA